MSRLGDLADFGTDDIGDLLRQFRGGFDPGFEGNIHIGFLALDRMGHRHHRRFGHLFRHQGGGLNLLGAQPVAGHVDDIIDASQDTDITIFRHHGRVAGQVGPVAPVFGIGIFIVLCKVGVHKPVAVPPDGLEHPRPGVLDADVARLAGTCRHFGAFFVKNDGMNTRHTRSGAARFHGDEARQGAAEKAAGFRLPVGIHDGGLALSHHIIIPLPHLGFDGFAHRGHVFELVVVLGRFIRTDLPQRTNGRRCRVKDVHIQILGNPPGASGIRIGGYAFVDDRGCGDGQGTVDDIGMARDPADVGHAPVYIRGMDVLDKLGSSGRVGQVTAGAVLAPLGLAGGAAGVHEKQRVFGVHLFGLDAGAVEFFNFVVGEEIPSLNHRCRSGVFAGIALPHKDFVHRLAILFRQVHSNVRILFMVQQRAATIISIRSNQHAASGVHDSVGTRTSAESAEYLAVDDTQPGTGQHGNRQFRYHGHMEGDTVPSFKAGEIPEKRREFVHTDIQLLIGDVLVALFQGFRDKVDGRFVLMLGQMTVHAVEAGVDLSPLEPLVARCVAGIEDFVPVGVPGQQIGIFLEAIRKILQTEAVVDLFVRHVGLGNEFRRGMIKLLFLPVNCNLSF